MVIGSKPRHTPQFRSWNTQEAYLSVSMDRLQACTRCHVLAPVLLSLRSNKQGIANDKESAHPTLWCTNEGSLMGKKMWKKCGLQCPHLGIPCKHTFLCGTDGPIMFSTEPGSCSRPRGALPKHISGPECLSAQALPPVFRPLWGPPETHIGKKISKNFWAYGP